MKRTLEIIRNIGIGKITTRESYVDVNVFNESFVNIPLSTVKPGFYHQMTPNVKFSFNCLDLNDVAKGFYKVHRDTTTMDNTPY